MVMILDFINHFLKPEVKNMDTLTTSLISLLVGGAVFVKLFHNRKGDCSP
jgi:hypothetical protein